MQRNLLKVGGPALVSGQGRVCYLPRPCRLPATLGLDTLNTGGLFSRV